MVEESAEGNWRIGDNDVVATTGVRVIGCGYNPSERNVFFTVNSRVVHTIYSNNDLFGMPLYPVLASNIGVSVFINLGQCSFKFNCANFGHSHNKSLALCREESSELFSIGRFNSQWQHRSRTDAIFSGRDILGGSQDFEDELFEIPLEALRKLVE